MYTVLTVLQVCTGFDQGPGSQHGRHCSRTWKDLQRLYFVHQGAGRCVTQSLLFSWPPLSATAWWSCHFHSLGHHWGQVNQPVPEVSGTTAFAQLVSVSRWADVFYRQLGRQAQLVIDVIKVNTDKDIQVKHVWSSYHRSGNFRY